MRSPLAALGVGLVSIGLIFIDFGRRRARGVGAFH